MTTPFEECATLNITGGKPKEQEDKPQVEKPFAHAQKHGAKLMIIVDNKSISHSFTYMGGELWDPMKINRYLEEVLKIDTRVNMQGVPYVPLT